MQLLKVDMKVELIREESVFIQQVLGGPLILANVCVADEKDHMMP